MFYKQVDKRYRETMGKFLRKHFRYNTMNSWNRSTSYANCIKLHHVDKPEDIDNETWWEMLWVSQWQEKLSDLLEDFGRRHQWQWQAGINGRSGGYVVIYRGGIKPSGYKSVAIKVIVRTVARRIIRLSRRARLALAADAMLKLV